MTTECHTRLFRTSDADSLIALWQKILPDSQPWNDPREALIRKLKLSDELVFVAEQNGKLIGAVKAGYDGVRGWIYSLAVLPEVRRCGIGRKLLEAAEAALIGRGCPKVNLQVRSSNSEVLEFYRRCGYVIEDRASLGKPLSPPARDGDSWPEMRVMDDITLSTVSWDDKSAYLKYLNETDEFQKNTSGIPYPYTSFDADRWLTDVVGQCAARDQQINLAIRGSSGELVGEVGLMNLTEGEQGEIGYWLAQSMWGKSVMPAVVRTFCRFAFERFQLQRIHARVFATNQRSARVLAKVGFTHEGTLRNGWFRNGEPIDDLLFGLLRDEIQIGD